MIRAAEQQPSEPGATARALEAIVGLALELRSAGGVDVTLEAAAVAALQATGGSESVIFTAPGGDIARGHEARAGGDEEVRRRRAATYQRRVLETGEHVRTFARTSGGRQPVLAVPVCGRDGERLGVLHVVGPGLTCDDETEHALVAVAALAGSAVVRFHLEQRWRHLERVEAVGRLATGLAHDFRNVLATILGAADTALGRADAIPEELRGDLQDIRTAASGGADLTRRLLTVARRRPRTARLLDVDAVLAGSTRMLAILAGPEVNVSVERSPGLPRVQVTMGLLEQALANLVTNARDAMPGGGRLRVSTSVQELDEPTERLPAGRYVRLTVRDNGQGMDEATRRRALEPFFTTKRHGEGTGLGLSTVAEEVRAAGGDIVLRSTPGRGTLVHLLLPVAGEPVAAAAATVSGGSETIAVVEDDDRVREVVSAMLRTLGYRVLAGTSAEEIGALAGSGETIDLLLADCRLAGEGGPQVAQALRGGDPGLPVLYVSGYDRELALGDRRDERALFLEKPFDVPALARHVRAALDLRRADERD